MAAKEKLEAILNVALRVPSIMLLDVLYRWDVSSFFQQIQRSSLHNNPLFQYKYLALNMHYVGYILSVVLLTLPRQHLVQLYLYFLTALLLYAGHQISRLQSKEPMSTYLAYTMTLEKLLDYVRSELESGYEGPMYLEPLSMNRFMTALVGQLVVCTLCSCVMKTKQIWLFSAHMLPLLARLCLVPLETIVIINKFAMIFTGLEVLYFLASNLLVPYNLAKSAYRELVQVVEVYGLLALGMSLWNQLVVPVLFMVFWLVLFALQIYSYFSTRDQPASRERLLFLFLTSIAECCSTPYSLLGLVFTVSFVALGVLTLCKFYLQGYRAFMNDPAMNRGMTEGVTLLILAVQTGLIELQVVHRAFLLSIILFIVVASILQSMLEIADPIVLALGASRDKSLWKHFRAVSLCLFLLVFPAYMAYMICQFFHMDFWLLIIISSSILTSLQVLGTLFIYVLFMVEEFRKEPVENMDDVIYYVNGTYRLLEFLVALCVVAYGVSETVFGEWTVMGSVIIFIHSYYNVWLRAQLGWKSFLLRRDAVNKIKSLPIATKEQLERHNDICAICYQDMKTAVITPCSHFFHAGCLKKWLYVQETCPLCHCQLKSPSQLPGLGPEPVQQLNPGAEQNTRPGDAAEPPGVEHDSGPNTDDNPSQSSGQVADGQDSLEASAETERSRGMDRGTSPCEASQGAACAAELMAAPEGCPARDPRVSIQL
ncbi:RING finger protein 145 isoform 1-T1 [Mergus octosetaceus]